MFVLDLLVHSLLTQCLITINVLKSCPEYCFMLVHLEQVHYSKHHKNLLIVCVHKHNLEGKLKYVSVERRAESGERKLESGKYRFYRVIFGEAVPISAELEID
jgi:hypothetical protein